MAQATLNAESLIEWSVAGRALPGQTVSGDLQVIKAFAGGILFGVVDGLGHGDEATRAAQGAVDALAKHADESLLSLAYRCNEALLQTRGVVMTVASLRWPEETITWLGIGNVEGVRLRPETRTHSRESVLLRGGVVGYQLPTLQATVLKVQPGDVFIFATDGIRGGFAETVNLKDTTRQIADRILRGCFKGTDDALVLVVRYVGERHE